MTTPRMRAGTTDRQDVVDRLSLHFAEGRLDTTEFDTRVTKAYGVTYLDELPELLEDLPEGHRQVAGTVSAWQPPARTGRSPQGRSRQGYRPDAWDRPLQRPPRWLGVAVLIGLLFTIGALTHGIFLFPLIWLAFAFAGAGRRRQHWDGQQGGGRPWEGNEPDWRCRR